MTMTGVLIPGILDAAARRVTELSDDVRDIRAAVMAIDAAHAWQAKAVHEYREEISRCGADMAQVGHFLEIALDGIRGASVNDFSWVG